MREENGEWIMCGTTRDDPKCIHTAGEAVKCIKEWGFLPLFQNAIPGFSLEERTVSGGWWSGDPDRDPWMWREILSRRGDLAYGKFFGQSAGFVSAEWFPHFANYRRDGYDFDARWDDELASIRQKKIMDLFDEETELFSFEVKQLAGFHKGGEKNFEGTVTGLQMQTYLCISDFKKRRNKKGEEYGWSIALYSRPERVLGAELVRSAYSIDPKESREKILEKLREDLPEVPRDQWRKFLK